VRRQVSRNDRENDHGEESKESKEGEQGSRRKEEDETGSGEQGCKKEDGKEDRKEDRFQATSREEDKGCCQKDDSQEARRQKGSCKENGPQEGGGQEGCAGAQTASCARTQASRTACARTQAGRTAAAEAGGCVSGTRAEARGSAASAATAGLRNAAGSRTHGAFADPPCRRIADDAAADRSCGPGEPYGAQAGIARSGVRAKPKHSAVKSRSYAAAARLKLERFGRSLGAPLALNG
jgi:hypothetical protein